MAENTKDAAKARRHCLDGGACHHECTGGACFREKCCLPLSGVFPGDVWPVRRHEWDSNDLDARCRRCPARWEDEGDRLSPCPAAAPPVQWREHRWNAAEYPSCLDCGQSARDAASACPRPPAAPQDAPPANAVCGLDGCEERFASQYAATTHRNAHREGRPPALAAPLADEPTRAQIHDWMRYQPHGDWGHRIARSLLRRLLTEQRERDAVREIIEWLRSSSPQGQAPSADELCVADEIERQWGGRR